MKQAIADAGEAVVWEASALMGWIRARWNLEDHEFATIEQIIDDIPKFFASPPSPDPVGALDALRNLAIKQHVRMAYGGTFVNNGRSCAVCKSQWLDDAPELHSVTCPLAASPDPVAVEGKRELDSGWLERDVSKATEQIAHGFNASALPLAEKALEEVHNALSRVPASMFCDAPYDEFYELLGRIDAALAAIRGEKK